ncbi:uncharacterized protein LOC133198407 [Saccostrea echinata]|uniref:uncharacterized protein LOC133198407 n=1 Tax=Saccostrea echinata TaxID=191078 RepID=UPI002A81B689|nr:uncharacterized protein LOC133198407 [Saccostrea echinata]
MATTISNVDGGQTCLSCKDIPEPIECSIVTQCGEHEQCFVQKYVNYAGHVRYDLGCASNLSCNMIPTRRKTVRVIGPDNSVVCEACCNNTVVCNGKGLCGSQVLPEHSGTLCYDCDFQSNPESCDHIKLCSVDRACYIGLVHDDTSALYHWVSGCALRETKCKSLEMFPDNPFCSSCCEGNLCNNRCHRNQSVDVCADQDQFCTLLKDRCQTMTDVRKACPRTCSLCPIDDCIDSVNTSCSSYNLFDICNTTSVYYPWASDHCRKSCGLCHPVVCEDTIPNCDEYNTDMCTNHTYAAFVYLHCRKYCQKC